MHIIDVILSLAESLHDAKVETYDWTYKRFIETSFKELFFLISKYNITFANNTNFNKIPYYGNNNKIRTYLTLVECLDENLSEVNFLNMNCIEFLADKKIFLHVNKIWNIKIYIIGT